MADSLLANLHIYAPLALVAFAVGKIVFLNNWQGAVETALIGAALYGIGKKAE